MKQQLKQQREVDSQQWRRSVRSGPLLKLRAELANMAAELHTLVTNTQLPHNQSVTTETTETTEKRQQQALKDWRDYMTSRKSLQTLYLQYDEELIQRVEGIERGYMLLFEFALDYRNLKKDDLIQFREISQSTKNKITEVQELINKKLEEL